jgi:hypothetical protein
MVRKTALLGKGISYTRLAPRRWLASLERAGNHLIDAAMHEVVDLVFPIFVRDLVLEDSDQYNGAMTTTWALCIVCLGYVHEESCRLSSTRNVGSRSRGCANGWLVLASIDLDVIILLCFVVSTLSYGKMWILV